VTWQNVVVYNPSLHFQYQILRDGMSSSGFGPESKRLPDTHLEACSVVGKKADPNGCPAVEGLERACSLAFCMV